MKFVWFAVFALISTTALAFEGRYGTTDRDYRQTLTIVKRPDGTFALAFTVSTRGCMGDWEVVGRANGETLNADEVDACHVEIRKVPNGVVVREWECDLHGQRCSFAGPYVAVSGAASAAAAPRLRGEFFCAREMDVDPARLADPNHRVRFPSPGTDPRSIYDSFFQAGLFGWSLGGDMTTHRFVRVTTKGNTATYRAPGGAHWVVSPIGANRITIRGTGIDGESTGVACAWR